LRNTGHDDIKEAILEKIQKFCHFYQLYDPLPRRFKFSIKDESYFNYKVVIDVVYLGERNALYIIDLDTSFQVATFLNSLSTRDT
jgi:PhoPQ-activated pathogenicity-related protein